MYDDNFGHWDGADEDTRDFYRQVQRNSVSKKCRGCGRMVRIMPQYAYCDGCATRMERGEDY
jgi:hypothetical protein